MKKQFILATLIFTVGNFCLAALTDQFFNELEARGKVIVYCGDADHNSLISVRTLDKGNSTQILINNQNPYWDTKRTIKGSFSSTYNASLEESLFTFGNNNGGSDFSQAGFHFNADKKSFSFYYNLWFEGPSFAITNCQVL